MHLTSTTLHATINQQNKKEKSMNLAPSDRINSQLPKYQIGEFVIIDNPAFEEEWGLITGINYQFSENNYRYQIQFKPEELTTECWEKCIIKSTKLEPIKLWVTDKQFLVTCLYSDFDLVSQWGFRDILFYYYFSVIKNHPRIKNILEEIQCFSTHEVLVNAHDQELLDVLFDCTEKGYSQLFYNYFEDDDKPNYHDLIECDRMNDMGEERDKRVWINIPPF